MSGWRSILVFLGVPLLSACVTLPVYMTDTLTPNDIVQNLRCQLAEAVTAEPEPHHWLRKFKASIVVTLKVLNQNDTKADGSLAIPLNPGLATPKIAIGLKTRATRTIDFNIKDKVENLIDATPCVSRSILLEGDLGFRGYLDRLRPIQAELDDPQKFANSNYTLEFYIEKGLTPSASFSMVPVGSRIFGANASVGLQAQYTHTLKITVTPPRSSCKEG